MSSPRPVLSAIPSKTWPSPSPGRPSPAALRKKRRSKQKLAEAAHVAHNAQADREAVLGGLIAQLLWHRATGRVEGRPTAADCPADPAALRSSAEVGACALPEWAATLDLVSPRLPEIVPEWVALDLTDGWITVEAAVAAVNTPALRATVPNATQSLGGFAYSAPDVWHAAKLPVVKEGMPRYELSEDAMCVRVAIGGIPRPHTEADNSTDAVAEKVPVAEAAEPTAVRIHTEAAEPTDVNTHTEAAEPTDVNIHTEAAEPTEPTVGGGGGADERMIKGEGGGFQRSTQRSTEAEGGAGDAHNDAVHKVDNHEPRESDDAVVEAPEADPEMTARLNAALRTATRRPSEVSRKSLGLEESPSIEASLLSAIKREPTPDTSPFGWYLPALEICASRTEAVRCSKNHHHHQQQQQQQWNPLILSAVASPAVASPTVASPAAASPAAASPAVASPAAASERVAPRPMPLTIATAPPLAVHGWFGMHAESLTKLGLTRMLRHHTPLLRREAAASVSSSSSGPRPCDYYIWVDVHRAIDGGVAFYHGRPVAGQGEVMLCDGVDGDGTLPPEYYALVVELKGGLTLTLPLLRLVQRLFAASSRVELSRMHGSAADAMHGERLGGRDPKPERDAIFLKSESFDERGKPDEPTVTVLGRATRIAREARALRQIAEIVRGEAAARVLRGPMCVDATGAESELPVSEGLSLIRDPPGSRQGEDGALMGRGRTGAGEDGQEEDGAVVGASDDDLHVLSSAANRSVLGTALGLGGFVTPRAASTGGFVTPRAASPVTPRAASPGTSSAPAVLGSSSAALGGFVLETAGACWALPEFYFKMQARVEACPLD